MHRQEMRASPAWRALPDNARRLLDRLELEHMTHGGASNGNLTVTYDQFAKAGLRRASVALAIRQAVELGFLEVTVAGYRTSAEFRAPNQFRITYVHGSRKNVDPTDEWANIKSDADAQLALARAAGQPNHTRQPPASRNGCGRQSLDPSVTTIAVSFE